MKILFAASECVPYSKTGGLADVVGALPKALASLGHDMEVLAPRYRMTRPGRPLPEARSLTLPLGSGIKFASVQEADRCKGLRHLLVDCPEYYDREQLYREKGADYPDNHLRFAAFSLACLEFTKRLTEAPAIIHCHDWQSALIPIYLASLYRNDVFFHATSVVLTIHNLAYQGVFPAGILPEISVSPRLFQLEGLEFYGKANLLKGGIIFSDFVTTVSRRYAEEIQTEEYGCGLEGVLASRSSRLQGILNGVDYDTWNPATDKLIPARYSPESLKGKQLCRKVLLERMGLKEPQTARPVLGIISRFDPQKGFDLIAQIAEELLSEDLYMVALGTGEPRYEQFFQTLAAKYPQKALVRIAYDNEMAHLIEAGADMFLMPSRYEPSGLNQLYSLKYGTVPIVRATGGLEDSVEQFDGNSGTGFKFFEYSSRALLGTIRQALAVYREPDKWRRLMQNGMAKDFSWAQSAGHYAKIYEALAKEKAHKASGRVPVVAR